MVKHITYSRVSNTHLKNIMKGKSFTIKPSDHENENNTMVEMEFNARKHLNRFHKNLEAGKGVRISPEHLKDIKVHNGNGFFDSIRNAFNPSNISHTLQDIANNPITKGIVKTIAPMAIKAGSQVLGTAVTNATGNPTIGNAVGNFAGNTAQSGVNSYTGSGFFDNIRSVASNNVVKGIMKASAPYVGSTLAASGHPIVGAIATGALNSAGSGIKMVRGRKSGGSFAPLGGVCGKEIVIHSCQKNL